MTPKEKAEELYYKFYNRIEHTLSEEYSPHEKDIVKQSALIAVDEILNTFEDIDDGQTVIPYDYWQQIKQEIEKL